MFNSLHLQHEIEELRARVGESSARLMQMESDFVAVQRGAELENARLTDELTKLRDRYDR